MALHHLTPDQTIAGRRFSLIRDFDRARLCYRQRCMIDGKPVRRAVWEAEMAEARATSAYATTFNTLAMREGFAPLSADAIGEYARYYNDPAEAFAAFVRDRHPEEHWG